MKANKTEVNSSLGRCKRIDSSLGKYKGAVKLHTDADGKRNSLFMTKKTKEIPIFSYFLVIKLLVCQKGNSYQT